MRIASLAPSITTMLQELGAADQIVACTHVCPLPAEQRARMAVGTFSVLNEEKLAVAKPDVVITATLVQRTGADRLGKAGYTVLHLDPRRLPDIADNYEELGAFIERADQGIKLKSEFLHELSAYSLQPTHYNLKVYMEEWHEPPFVSGNWVPDIVKAAGGQSVLIQPGDPSREISLEELRETDPDVIIQHVCLPPGRNWQRRREHMQQELVQRPRWQELRAVRMNHVYSLEDTPFNMPTKGALQGVQMVREVLENIQVPA